MGVHRSFAVFTAFCGVIVDLKSICMFFHDSLVVSKFALAMIPERSCKNVVGGHAQTNIWMPMAG